MNGRELGRGHREGRLRHGRRRLEGVLTFRCSLSCLFLSSWNDMLRPASPRSSLRSSPRRSSRENLPSVSPQPRRVAPGGGTEAALLGKGRESRGAARRTRGARASPNPSPRTIFAMPSIEPVRVARVCRTPRAVSSAGWGGAEKCAMCQRANSSNRRLAIAGFFRSFCPQQRQLDAPEMTCSLSGLRSPKT